MVGMLLSTDGAVPLDIFFFGLLGIALGAASGAAVNHWVDQRIDAIMERTQGRPLPQGIVVAFHPGARRAGHIDLEPAI